MLPPFIIPVKVFHQQGSGSHDTHVTNENVPDFRQFIQGCAAQGFAKIREPHFVRQEVPLFIPRIRHGTEFVDIKNLPVQTGPGLGKEHRRAKFHPHQDVEDKINGGKDEDGRAAEYDID